MEIQRIKASLTDPETMKEIYEEVQDEIRYIQMIIGEYESRRDYARNEYNNLVRDAGREDQLHLEYQDSEEPR